MKKEINVALRNYEGLKDEFTQVANSMHDHISDPYTFTVYFYLCRVYNRNYHYAFPSIKNIAERCHIGETKVKQCLKWLSEKGYIEKKKVKYGNCYCNNTYIIRYIDTSDIIEELIKHDDKIYVTIEIEVDDIETETDDIEQ